MSKELTKMENIDRDSFIQVLKEKNKSIRYIGNPNNHICSEKTIRRALKNGKMKKAYVDDISQFLNVDPRYLTGEVQKKLMNINVDSSRLHSKMFPYFQKKMDDDNDLSSFWESFLLLFAISKDQFDEMDFEEQYAFQHEVFEAIIPIIYRYFDKDGCGDESLRTVDKVLDDLETYHDSYYENKYANCILRPELIANPPDGYTVKQIKDIPPNELIELSMFISRDPEEERKAEEYFENKYGHI